jgi:catechol 2,3-dioxygenase-like lactoylglutathione lyase family enzyme
MALKKMDNVLIVVEDLEAVKTFFLDLGLKLEGQTTVEGPLVGSLIGLKDVRATLAMLRTPDGHGGIELDKFHTPEPVRYGPVDAPVNALGLRRVMFNVEGIDEVVARMRARGAELIGEMNYEDAYRLAYIRGPEGIAGWSASAAFPWLRTNSSVQSAIACNRTIAVRINSEPP